MEFKDTYFFSYEEAYKVAKEQNKKDGGYTLQLCYYDGEYQENDLVNLVNLPIDNIGENLALGALRLPSDIDFAGTNFSEDIQTLILNNFQENLKAAQQLRDKFNTHYFMMAKKLKPNFDEPLRFYLMAHENTQVMKHIAKHIVDVLEEQGYSVCFKYEYGIEDGKSFKDFVEFNPHVTININNLNSFYLSEDVYNFVWFQDPMPVLINDTQVNLRKRDHIYSLLTVLDTYLKKKDIPFERQSFCINTKTFYNDPEIKREKKIVFIGSSYADMIPNDPHIQALIDAIVKLFIDGKTFTEDLIDELSQKFNIDKGFITARVIPYVVRDFSVLILCELKTPYKVEIYGKGWEKYPSIKSFYHGPVEYGDALREVYNTATYVFAPHQNYILQQRTLEGAACGAIPIVYDCRDLSDEKTYEEAISYYKTNGELEEILNNENTENKDLSNLVNENTYYSLVNKIIETVKEEQDAR